MHQLQEIEADAGRVPTVRWGERTLDLDVLLFGDDIFDTPELSVPHPRMAVRRFVLVPLEEIAPNARDPLTGRTISELRANLDRRPSYLALEGWWSAGKAPGSRTYCCGAGCPLLEPRDLEEVANCLSSDGIRSPFGLLEKSLEFLAEPHRSIWGEQWIVTDSTVADLVAAATVRWGPLSKAQPGSLTRRLATLELDLVEPTFIVAGGRQAGDWPELQALLRSTPRLRLESTGPDQQVSEILAACAASRT